MKTTTALKHKRARAEAFAAHKKIVDDYRNRNLLRKVELVRNERAIRHYCAAHLLDKQESQLPGIADEVRRTMARQLADKLLEDGMFEIRVELYEDFLNPDLMRIEARLDVVEPRKE